MSKSEKISARSRERLRTQHVFLDTQAYRKLGHNPNSPPLVALKDLLKSGRLVLHITDITLHEIERQLREYVGETTAALSTATRSLGRWKARHPNLVAVLPEFDEARIAAAAFDEFSRFVSDVAARHHTMDAVLPSTVFDRYFKREAPFHKPDSKEFPDAFVLAMLEAWCGANRERLYVVGADRAVRDAAEQSDVLLPMDSLEDLLAAVASMDEPRLVERASRLMARSSVQSRLKLEVTAQVDHLIPIYVGTNLPEGEVVGHRLSGDVEIGDFKILAVSPGEMRVVVPVKIPLAIDIVYEDRSDASYDNEEGIYLLGETSTSELDAKPVVRFHVRIGKSEDGRDLEVSARPLNQELHVNDPVDIFR